MNTVLGPVPCSACRRSVVWDGWEWKNAAGPGARFKHECPSNERAISLASERDSSYDSRAGSSSESASIATVARVSATTRSAGDVASIEVVAR